MSTEENKALYHRLLEGAMNQRNLGIVDELCNPDFVLHRGSTTIQAREPYKQFLSMYLTASPDFHLTIEDLVAEGDKVVCRFTGSGTHLGPFMGIPPTGKHVTATGSAIIRVANEEIVEEWSNGDDLGLLQQLGVVPLQGQTS